jgi:hypothetical protein
VCPRRLRRYRYTANWVCTLYIYPPDHSRYIWPETLIVNLVAAAAQSPILPRLRHICLGQQDLDSPPSQALSWVVPLLHPGLESIDFATQTGMELSYIDVWRLCMEVRDLEIPIKRLTVHCPYTYPSTPERTGLQHAIFGIAGIYSLTSLSITGALCNKQALVCFSILPGLSALDIMGSPSQDIRGALLQDKSFPSLRRLSLRYFDEISAKRMCSLSRLLHHVTHIEVQWDPEVEAGDSKINRTVAHIAEHCPLLESLTLGLYLSGPSGGLAHELPFSVWQSLRSETVTSVTMMGLTMARIRPSHIVKTVKETWPNLVTFTNSLQALGPSELQNPFCKGSISA